MTPPLPRLLVVDDERDIRERLAASMRLSGYTVDTAECGMEALDVASTVRPDLMVPTW
jgi:DNA-binding response OmpR family regulator